MLGSLGIGYWPDEFFKKGIIGYHVVKQWVIRYGGNKKGVIGYWTDQKRWSIDRHVLVSQSVLVDDEASEREKERLQFPVNT